jgi:hypothetical protein
MNKVNNLHKMNKMMGQIAVFTGNVLRIQVRSAKKAVV